MKNILLIIIIFVFLFSHYLYYNNKYLESFKDKCYSKCKYKFDKCDNNKEKCRQKYNKCYKKCGFYPKEAVYWNDWRGNIIVDGKFITDPCCQ